MILPLFFALLIAGTLAHWTMMLRLSNAGEPVRFYRAFWQYEAYYRRYAVLAPERGWGLWPYHAAWLLLGGAALLVPFVAKALNDRPQKLDLTAGPGLVAWAALVAGLVAWAYLTRPRAE
jgi:hypothetical protein